MSSKHVFTRLEKLWDSFSHPTPHELHHRCVREARRQRERHLLVLASCGTVLWVALEVYLIKQFNVPSWPLTLISGLFGVALGRWLGRYN